MNDSGKRLKEFIAQYYNSITDFAKTANKSVQQISEITRGDQNVGVKLANSLEESTGISASWLLSGSGMMCADNEIGNKLVNHTTNYVSESTSLYTVKPSLNRAVKLFMSSVGAGSNPEFNISNKMVSFDELMGITENSIIALVDDDFPYENIHRGDSVIVDTSAKVRNYDLCLVKYLNNSILSRIITKDNDTYILPQNMQEAPIKIINPDELLIIGVVKNVIVKK